METENIENVDKLESAECVTTTHSNSIGGSMTKIVADESTDKLNASVEPTPVSPSPMKSKILNSVLKPRNVDDKTKEKIEKVDAHDDSVTIVKDDISICEESENIQEIKFVSVKTKSRTELQLLYKDASVMLQRFKTALQTHRTKTFFRPDVVFIKTISAAILQVEGGLNKMGQLFSSSNYSGTIEKGRSLDCTTLDITPPASEAGVDVALNDSTIESISSNTAAVNTSSSSDATAGCWSFTDRKFAASASAAVKVKVEEPSQGSTRGKTRGRKRKLDDSVSVPATPTSKRPRRSLLSHFLENNTKEKEKKEDEEEEEEDGDNKQEKDEFEVEKILDYGKVKGKCSYQVRWRGYKTDDDTWEPLNNLTGCEAILLTFIRTRLVERSKVKDSEELKSLLLPCEDGVKVLLRGAFFAQLTAPKQNNVDAVVHLLVSGKVRVKEMPELEEDIDKLMATKDCLSDRYHKMFFDLKQQLSLRECNQQRQRQLAELRRWEREMSRISCAPAPLCVVNDVDLSLPPDDFVYINNYIAAKGITIPEDPVVGCSCTDCGGSQNTCCAKQMNSYFAYSKHGRLKVSLGTAIYECNKLCACVKTGSCYNRVVQKGRTVQLTIFRTANNRGWGVKAGELIRAGSFVSQYVGEVISSEEAERRGQIYDARGCTYLFDLDYNRGDQNLYTVDAAKYGNVSHFINHSCDPNLVVFNVWINCLDPDLPKLALFAAREIRKGEEITFDYNSPCSRPQNIAPTIAENDLDSSNSTESPIRVKAELGSLEMAVGRTPKRGIAHGKTKCRCGAANCRQYFF
uniref:Histone-lysine N-methyltransferase Su(Var)3-9-like n=1 Tax=Hirondellea gigas TaxID=1518452 RepID=A0A6A7FQG3_9CRUS